jgi:ribosomal protein S18 acetylase RimI-like enzyme
VGAGLTRPATYHDLPNLGAFLARWAESVEEPVPDPSWIESDWSMPGFDVKRDHWLEERDGDVVGYVALDPAGLVRARGDVATLLPPLHERARKRGDERLETIVTTRAEGMLDALSAAGWTRERDVYRMWLDLSEPPPEARFPATADVRAYTDADARGLHAFVDLAYSQNNERTPPFDQWLHFMTGTDDYDAAYWHLAEENGALIGCCLTWAPHPNGGWVKDLAVHPEHRRRGLGEALLHHAHGRYRKAGVRRVGLKVDSDNPTAAYRLYERLGYVTDRVYAVLSKRP